MSTLLLLVLIYLSATHAARATIVHLQEVHTEGGSPDTQPVEDCLFQGMGFSGDSLETISKKSLNLRLEMLNLPYNLKPKSLSAHSCHFLCRSTARCRAYTVEQKAETCTLYKTVLRQYRHKGSVSGLIYCEKPECSCRNVMMSGTSCDQLKDGKRPVGQVPGKVFTPEQCRNMATKFNCSYWYHLHSSCTLLSSMDKMFMSLYRGAVSGSTTACTLPNVQEDFCQLLAKKHYTAMNNALGKERNHTDGIILLTNASHAEVISRRIPDEHGRIIIDQEDSSVIWAPFQPSTASTRIVTSTPTPRMTLKEEEKIVTSSSGTKSLNNTANNVADPTVAYELEVIKSDNTGSSLGERTPAWYVHSCIYFLVALYIMHSHITLKQNTALIIMLAIGSVQANIGLTAYDTSGHYTGKPPTVKVIDAISVEGCEDVTSHYGQPQSVEMEVLHRGSTVPLDVLECKIMIKTTSQYCETNIFVSKSYPRKTLTPNQLIWFSREDCEKARRTKQVEIPVLGSLIRVTDLDETEQTGEIFLYGRQASNGGCEGADIVVGERLLKSSIVVAHYTIRIRLKEAKYSPTNKVLTLSDHTKLDGSRDFISISDKGHFFYNKSSVPENSCERMASLFIGTALIHPGKQDRQNIVVVHSTSGDKEVAFVMDSKVEICGRQLYSTNIVNIFLLRLDPGVQKLKHRLSSKIQNSLERDEKGFLELSSIISTTYLQASLSTTQNFERVAQAFCLSRRANLLGLLRDLNMDVNRNNYREGISYLRRGSMLYIFFGTAIDAQIRLTDQCYQEIPVSVKTSNGTVEAFATSNGKILVANATAISCKSNERVPAGHFIRDGRLRQNSTVELSELFEPSNFAQRHKNVTGKWICLGKQMILPCHQPQRLDPASRKWFNFVAPNSTRIAGSSLFGKEDMRTLFDTQTVDVIKASWYNNLVLAHLGKVVLRRGQHMISSLSQIQVSELTKHLNPFGWSIFGDWISAINMILAISFLIAVIYNVVCGLIRLKTGLRVYGCSFRILLAFFGSVWSSFLPFLVENKPATRRLNVVEELQTQNMRKGQNTKRQLEVLLHILSAHFHNSGSNLEEINVGYIFTDPSTGQQTVKPVFPLHEAPTAPKDTIKGSVEYIEMDSS